MEYTGIETKNENGIFTITFNRPERLNALDRATLEELNHALETIENTDGIRVVIVKGSGKAFIAGADISAMVNMTGKEAEEFSKFGQDVFLRLENLDVPVIASVNGFCLG
ncbi:MAG: enoyl-CoA hydratase/isomerase family protein, partial [Caldisericia bacterium]|nr:enoyl-CoA hydratase/isomerase family protein [Caldisericia bacterium]